ncbi:hypothetical protein RIF29_34963 [Crotalaria pallida]|uniref:Neprosin PEP catalytic domain-containing protein n=1 Tax=Crotalaria pallida TaxID=3830 RepID=A0AAN9HTT1_CROPI
MNTTSSSSKVHPEIFRENKLVAHLLTSTPNTIYRGARAAISLCNLSLQAHQYSLSQIWLESGLEDETNAIHEWMDIKKPDATILIAQDKLMGNWWLYTTNPDVLVIGYWPNEIFTHLKEGALRVYFGGETYTPLDMDSPQMGSGRYPKQGLDNSAFMSVLGIVDSDYNENDINLDVMRAYVSRDCYDLGHIGYWNVHFGHAFLFGGPGGKCDE